MKTIIMITAEKGISGILPVVFCAAVMISSCQTNGKKKHQQQIAGEQKAVVIVDNQEEKKVDIYVDAEVFTSYIYPENLEKPVLFPVLTAAGTPVNRAYPLESRAGERTDHPHQVGVWFNYGDVNGYDFWNHSHLIPEESKDEYGWIIHRGVKKSETRGHTGLLELAMDWQVYREDGSIFTILQENTSYLFSGTENIRVIDRITRLTAQEEEVVFTDNKEGLFAIRLRRAFEYPSKKPLVLTDATGQPSGVAVRDNEGVSGHYRNSRGTEGLDVWGRRAEWVRLNGIVGDERITIAMFDHPGNPGAPSYWHARGYGLFAVNNLGQKIFSDGAEELNLELTPGESVTFRHRLYLTSGYWAGDEELDQLYQEFSN